MYRIDCDAVYCKKGSTVKELISTLIHFANLVLLHIITYIHVIFGSSYYI